MQLIITYPGQQKNLFKTERISKGLRQERIKEAAEDCKHSEIFCFGHLPDSVKKHTAEIFTKTEEVRQVINLSPTFLTVYNQKARQSRRKTEQEINTDCRQIALDIHPKATYQLIRS